MKHSLYFYKVTDEANKGEKFFFMFNTNVFTLFIVLEFKLMIALYIYILYNNNDDDDDEQVGRRIVFKLFFFLFVLGCFFFLFNESLFFQ